jgi:predicted DNA repair protein MutK
MGLRAIAESLVALAVVLAVFGAIMVVQRLRRGEGVVQAKDGSKLGDLLVHAAPFLCLSLAYNAVMRARLDPTIEFAAMVAIFIGFAGATYRLFKRLEGLQRE